MIHRASVAVRRGAWTATLHGYAFNLERVCWFFVPDAGAPESLFGKRTRIVLERGSGSRAGRPIRARVIRLATVRALAEELREMAEGLL